MLHEKLTTKELAVEYRRHLAGKPPLCPDPEFNAVFVWEDWICESPEKAWPVFLELLAQPVDDDTLEQITYRLELLLVRHWEAFHKQVENLVTGHSELPRFFSKEALCKEQFEATPVVPDDEIVQAYLTMYHHSVNISHVEKLIASDERALPLVLEIVQRGPLYGFDSFDLFSLLQDLLRHQGAAVIDEIEQAAQTSVMLRRCLWRMKRHEQNAPPKYRIAAPLWQRAAQAAGTTTDYNSDLPAVVQPRLLPPEEESLIVSWFAYKQTFWSFEELLGLIRNDPERLWRILLALVAAAPDEATLKYLGAGPLEDLLSGYGEKFIDRVEQQAVIDAKFRCCLAGVWQAGQSNDLWRRVNRALGK